MAAMKISDLAPVTDVAELTEQELKSVVGGSQGLPEGGGGGGIPVRPPVLTDLGGTEWMVHVKVIKLDQGHKNEGGR